VTIRLGELGIRAVLLDIEGTTTPMAFVHEVLFPFARARVASWFADEANADAGRAIAGRLEAEHAVDREAPGPLTSHADYALWLMERDRKSPALKDLQGLIWEDGYRAGMLRGVVFDDVPPAIRRWRSGACDVAIYSSGSELAQRRLFESIPQGDPSPCVSHFFDTRMGGKKEAASYRKIARTLALPADRVLFISDVTAELQAAAEAGCSVVLSERPGNAPQPDAERFPRIMSFAEVV
jgi:enolase-phosphatase E1